MSTKLSNSTATKYTPFPQMYSYENITLPTNNMQTIIVPVSDIQSESKLVRVFLKKSLVKKILESKMPINPVILGLMQKGIRQQADAYSYSMLDTVSVTIRISETFFKTIESISALHFGGNLGTTVGALVHLGSGMTEESMPSLKTVHGNNATKRLADGKWGTGVELRQLRFMSMVSIKDCAAICSVAKSTFAKYEITPVGMSTEILQKMIFKLGEWVATNHPDRMTTISLELQQHLVSNGFLPQPEGESLSADWPTPEDIRAIRKMFKLSIKDAATVIKRRKETLRDNEVAESGSIGVRRDIARRYIYWAMEHRSETLETASPQVRLFMKTLQSLSQNDTEAQSELSPEPDQSLVETNDPT
jgi:DNA-binding transcriptional regulator YiaG